MANYKWSFANVGGVTRVRIHDAEDIRHLGELDKKMWTVLSCPTTGLEISDESLGLMDLDGDGQLRLKEVVATAEWLCANLKDPQSLFEQKDELALDNIADEAIVAVAKKVLSRMANVISTYVSRQAIVAVIDGCASGLIVFVLSLFTGVPTSIAIPMGLITMLFYLIPMFGQFIGGTLVTLILLFNSPLAAVIFAVIYIIYAQIENNIVAPKIQGNTLNLPAVAILVAIVIGMYMFGLLGAIVAVPIAGCIRVLMDEYPNIKAARR